MSVCVEGMEQKMREALPWVNLSKQISGLENKDKARLLL